MSELILSAKKHLKQIIPEAMEIDIKLHRDHEQIVSKVHIHLPGKVLHATKKSLNVREALDSSCEAIIKQMQKFKTKRAPKRKNWKWPILGEAVPP